MLISGRIWTCLDGGFDESLEKKVPRLQIRVYNSTIDYKFGDKFNNVTKIVITFNLKKVLKLYIQISEKQRFFVMIVKYCPSAHC